MILAELYKRGKLILWAARWAGERMGNITSLSVQRWADWGDI